MASEVTLPALGESVTEGTVTRWLKQVGDTVAVDEPLLEVSTDKVDTEIPSPVAGTLLEIKANEDDTVEIGAVLALIGAADESAGGGETTGDTGDAAPAEEPTAEVVSEPEQPAQTPLDEEKTEHDEAEEQAEQADVPAEQRVEEEQGAQHEAPREGVAGSSGGGDRTVVRLR